MEYLIRAASESDMKEVAQVHKVCFPFSFSTKLGVGLLSSYYAEFYKETPYLFYVCTNIDGVICGFVMGYVLGRSNASKKFLKNNLFSIGLKILLLLICFDKQTWKKVGCTLFKKKSNPSEVSDNKNGEGDLLSICVTDEMKGTGAAAALVKEFHKALVSHGHKVCYLTCETSNPRGVAFYKKLGYDISEQTTDKICFRKDLV